MLAFWYHNYMYIQHANKAQPVERQACVHGTGYRGGVREAECPWRQPYITVGDRQGTRAALPLPHIIVSSAAE